MSKIIIAVFVSLFVLGCAMEPTESVQEVDSSELNADAVDITGEDISVEQHELQIAVCGVFPLPNCETFYIQCLQDGGSRQSCLALANRMNRNCECIWY